MDPVDSQGQLLLDYSIYDALRAGFGKVICVIKPKLECEYFLPLIPNQLISEGRATVAVLPTREKWYGVTYHEDMAKVRAAISGMRQSGRYPDRLWREPVC